MSQQLKHWIQFRNNLSAQDLARIRRTVKAMQERPGGMSTHTPTMSGGSSHTPLVGGRTNKRPPSPACKARHYRMVYKVHATGKPLSSAKYRVGKSSGALQELAEELVEQALRKIKPLVPATTNVPATVRQAVESAVHRGYMTEREAQTYYRKYTGDRSVDDHITLYLREQGSRSIREYEGCYRMLKHPSVQDVCDGFTRRLVVNHVDTFRMTA